MNIVSHSFFHFTPDFVSLTSILKNGFYKHYCKESIYLTQGENKVIGIPMLCFCDIPLMHIKDITYGEFGIGMDKKWGWLNAHLEPVHYYPNNGNCPSTKIIKKASQTFISSQPDQESIKVLGSAKPYFAIDSAEKKKCNYLDREWRVTGTPNLWMKPDSPNFNKCTIPKNKKQPIGSQISYSVQHVDFLIVPERKHKDLIDFIWGLEQICSPQGQELTENEKLLLISRIIDRETIIKNL